MPAGIEQTYSQKVTQLNICDGVIQSKLTKVPKLTESNLITNQSNILLAVFILNKASISR